MGYDLLFQQAVRLHENGELNKAENIYRQILETAPDNPDVLNLMGLIAQAKGLHEQACGWFYRAIRQAPDAAAFYFNLGLSLFNDNHPHEAVDAYQKAITLQPRQKESYNYLAEVWRSLGNKDAAAENYRKALELDAEYLDARINLAYLNQDTAALERITAQHPDNAMAVYYLSLVYRAAGQNLKAFELLQKMTDCPVFDIQLARGELALEFAPDQAENCFAAALDLNPRSVNALINLGNFAVSRNDFQQAERYYQRALELDNTDLEAHIGYADMLHRSGRKAEALEQYRAAVLINPESPELSNNLGLLLRETGEYTEALGLFFNAFTKAPEKEEYSLNIAETLTLLYYRDADTAAAIAANWQAQAPQNAFAARINAAFKGELNEDNQIYTQKLFDNFADNYELVLANIGYELPRRFRAITGDVKGTVVDLGCGSGLVGVAYKTDFTDLVGVDISEKMLEKAAEKHCYRSLIKEDILTFCQREIASLSPALITAADVCCYLSDLEPLFKACSPFPFIFSIENAAPEIASTRLNPAGRYQHNPDLTAELLGKYYDTIRQTAVTLRQENGKDVAGTVFYACSASIA